MVTINAGLLILAAFLIFEIGVYVGGELEKKKGGQEMKKWSPNKLMWILIGVEIVVLLAFMATLAIVMI